MRRNTGGLTVGNAARGFADGLDKGVASAMSAAQQTNGESMADLPDVRP
jgi:hypothetical protein